MSRSSQDFVVRPGQPLSVQFTVSDVLAADVDTQTWIATTATGTVVPTPSVSINVAAATNGVDCVASFTISGADTTGLNGYYSHELCLYDSNGVLIGGASGQMYAGGVLFTVDDARAFDKGQLGDDSVYPDADIVAKEAEIRQSFEDVICGIHFNPTVITDYRDANRTRQLWLTHHNPLLESPPRQITVSSVLIDGGNGVGAGHTFTPAELADLACYPDGRVIRKTLGYWISSFPYGELAVQITYTVGYLTPPPDIKRAALLVCVEQMTKKNLPDRLKSYSDETGSYELYMPGASNPASVYGIPEVTTILNNYAEDPVSVG